MSPTIYGVHADAWVPLAMAFYRAILNQGGLVWTRFTSSTYVCRRVAYVRMNASGNISNILRYRKAMNSSKEGAPWRSLAVSLDIVARFSTGGTDRGG